MPGLQKQIIQEFGSPLTQKLYIEKADAGLWGSEEILIKKYFRKGSSVLDIGCGTGRTTIPLKKMGYRVSGIDLTPAMVKNAKKIARAKKLAIPYRLMDAKKMSFHNHSFDNAFFSFNGWSQIPTKEERAKVIQEAYRVLKPGGYYIFTATSISPRRWHAWAKNLFKLGVLKPLGFEILESSFGDYFFRREYNQKKSRQKQFLNFTRQALVKKQIRQAGFDLATAGYCNDLSQKNTPCWPGLPCAKSPTFYVCRKPKN